ncbi:MAG: leucyl aminopeptidase [Alphaproteobacteria bacterium]|nr:leucyl aminopeptidase [Alphaproteobacteria bacterium]
MSISIKFSSKSAADTAVVFIHTGNKLSPAAQDLDKKSGGLLKRALESAPKFTGKAGNALTLALPEKTGFQRVICLGLGDLKDTAMPEAEKLGGNLFPVLESADIQKAVILADDVNSEFLAHLAAGLKLRSYKFDRYKSKKKDAPKPLSEITIVTPAHKQAAGLFTDLNHTLKSVFIARDLVNMPPNDLYPAWYADFIKKELTPLGVSVEILDEKKMKTLGMGAILAVGMGSSRKPRMVIMRWNGASKKSKGGPVALVGKGVTFDTGGISLKPGEAMDEMKMDMGGSAAVVGAIRALALRKSKADVVGIVGLAENMPSDEAYRPGDILTSYAGKTIEVLNTDAEGRLVLADCLGYLQDKYKPRVIVDLATLTGAIMVALGHEYAGTFATTDDLWKKLEGAGTAASEKIWRMPLDETWLKDVESDVADVRNTSKSGRLGGSCSAAAFLQNFVEDGIPWAHIDIAGTAWIKKDRPTVPRFGTGFGVRLLERFVAENYE